MFFHGLMARTGRPDTAYRASETQLARAYRHKVTPHVASLHGAEKYCDSVLGENNLHRVVEQVRCDVRKRPYSCHYSFMFVM